jgi:phosphonate transport system substrate-binding protein
MSRAVTAFAAAFVALALSQGTALAQWQEQYPVLRIGMVTGVDPAATRARAAPLAAYLEQRLGVDIEILLTNDYQALISGQLTDRFHATFLTASAFASANDICSNCLEAAAVPTNIDGELGFYSVLIARPQGAIDDPTDLPGARLAVSAEDSVTGRLLPLSLFAEDGIDVATIDIRETSSPAAAIELLLADGADAALAWSSLAGDEAAGYTRGALRQLVDAGRLTMEEIAIVWSSQLIPHGPLAIAADLPDELKADVTAAMIEMANTDPDALAAANSVLGGAFVEAPPDLYAPLMLLYAAF